MKLGEMPLASLSDVPFAEALHYSCRDADATCRLKPRLWERITAMGLEGVYRLELSTYHLIDRMMMIGIKPDLDRFAKFSFRLQGEIEELQVRLDRATGIAAFNANSHHQVRALLFDTYGLPEAKRTPGGDASTNDIILEALEREYGVQYPAIPLIRDYRETYKLKNTFCVAPETRILTKDLQWVEAGLLNKGAKLLAFDEYPTGANGQYRSWRDSRVISTQRLVKSCVQLVFEDGSSVVCSTDHKWLARKGPQGKAEWIRADALLASDHAAQARHSYRIIKPLRVWSNDQDFDDGWLSGVLDGEGCLIPYKGRTQFRLVVAQNEGLVLDKLRRLLRERNVEWSESLSTTGNVKLNIGRQDLIIETLGRTRPIRLLDKFYQQQELPSIVLSRDIGIQDRILLGPREVVALETSTHTFIAEGLASHNCDRIPDFVARYPFDGRVHATFRTTRVVTGRLAASDPNLLALPEHGDLAYLFKYGWVAEEGHVLGAWDESQIELRVLAHLSKDPVLLAAYRDGLDLHAALAVRIFGGKPDDHKKGTGRLAAKAINFGIPMGMQAQGLCLQLRKNGLLDVDEDDAQRWLDETAAMYKGVAKYKDLRIAEARRTGYVRCLSGRVRYVGGIHSWDRAVRAENERFAFSTPIQETAQYVMKLAEAALWRELRKLWEKGIWIEPLMQVHDAIKLEMEEDSQYLVNKIMQRCMVDEVQHVLCVPLAIEGEWGRNLAPTEVKDKNGKVVWSNPEGMRRFD